MTEELLAKWREAQDKLRQAKEALDSFQEFVVRFQEEQARIAEKLQFPSVAGLDQEAFKQFLNQPYLLMPRRQDSWYVVVPKFVDMQLGWLEWTTPSYNVFVINKYVRWMAPLPREIEERLGPTPTTQAKVVDGLLKVSAGMEEQAWQRYRKYLCKRNQFGIRIKRGYERHLLSSLIQDGYLPFTPRPVDKEDLSPPPAGFEPLPHQKEALDQWFQWGAVGVYWPGGMGKTYLGAAICAMVKGKKLVVVPNITEKEQWQVYLRKFNARDVQLETYSAWHKVQGKEYILIVYDECLPYDAKVVTDRGLIPIGKIVEEKLPVKVLTHRGRFKRILHYFKMPLLKRLLMVVFEGGSLTLTEDHKVLTDRGFVPALNLNSGDSVFSINEMQILHEGVSNISGFRRAYGNSTQARPSEKENSICLVKSFETREENSECKERSSQILREARLSRANSGAERCHSWIGSGRWFDHKEPRRHSSETPNSSFFKPVRVRYVEVLSSEKYCEDAPKGCEEWRMGSSGCKVCNSDPSLDYRALQHFLHREAKKDNNAFTEADKLSIPCYTLYGRWRSIKKEDGSFPYGELSFRRYSTLSRLSTGKVGVGGQHLSFKEKVLFCGVNGGINQEVFQNNFTSHSSINEIQNGFVYDVEVEEDHTFVVEGIIVSNCHRLPAPVWSRFATVESKYRLGFSATPYREDGREDLIIALTGYPVGLSWEHFLQAKAIRKPRIICKVVSTDREKLSVLEDLLKIPMKTLIFVELIASGEKIAKHFNLPFVYGNTKDRLDVISKNLVTVVSRVGDEGISIKDLERTIEVEFLGGSRRQEAQRAYRLLHSVKPEISHTVIMTVNELDQFGRRFLALEEKGFKIEYVS